LREKNCDAKQCCCGFGLAGGEGTEEVEPVEAVDEVETLC